MSTVAEGAPSQARTFGNFFVPRAAGFGALGWLGSVVAGGGTLLALLLVALGAGLVAMLVTFAVTGLAVLTLLFRNAEGLNLGQRGTRRVLFWRGHRSGAAECRAGVLAYGQRRLPGIAAQSELTEPVDSWGQPYGLLSIPAVGDYAVRFVCEPSGSQMADRQVIEQLVANYGGWLAGHAQEDSLVAASLTVQTRPDPGHRVRAAVEPRIRDGAPAVAVASVRQTLDRLSAGGASVQAWSSVTFTATPTGGGPRRTPDLMAADLGPRVPLIGDALSATGMGATHPMTAQELCELTLGAYDQEAADVIEAAHAAGENVPLSWTGAGPAAASAGWSWYRHNDGWSRTWLMTAPPRGEVSATGLARLLAPHPAVPVKRVTLLYRPWDIGEAAKRVEKDANDAGWAVNNPQKSRVAARAEDQFARARKTAREEAAGAALLNFTAVVTATVTDEAQQRVAAAVVSSLTKSARLQMHPAYAQQDTAFLYGLGLGLVPAHHAPMSDTIREKF